MEEKILQMIKGKLGTTSLSERTLSQKAKRIASRITKEEEITDSLIDDAVSDLKDMSGQYNNDVAAKTKEFNEKIKALEDELKKNKQADPPPAGNPDTPAWFLEFQKQQQAKMETIEEQMKAIKGSNKLNDFKASLKKAMIDKGATHDYFVDMVLNTIQTVGDSDTVDGMIETHLLRYDAEVKKALGDGASPRHTGVLDLSKADKELKDYFKGKYASDT